MKIYVASSWRNRHQHDVVDTLRADGYDVYDFKNPANKSGFGWHEIDRYWQAWSAEEFRQALDHKLAEAGFKSDMDALRACDACVLVLPCGRSAHTEAGWAAGAGKKTIVYYPADKGVANQEPELMYKMFDFCTSMKEVQEQLRHFST